MDVVVCAALFTLPFGAESLVGRFEDEGFVDSFSRGFVLVVPGAIAWAFDNWHEVRVDAETDGTWG